MDKIKSQDMNKILRVLFPNNFEKLDFSRNLAQYSSLVKGINAKGSKLGRSSVDIYLGDPKMLPVRNVTNVLAFVKTVYER